MAIRRSRAQQQEQQPEQRREAGPGVLRLLPSDSITEHRIDLPSGTTLVYTATAGTLALYDQSGEQTARCSIPPMSPRTSVTRPVP